MSETIKITDVFNGLSVPNKTYVAQENGKYEKSLKLGLHELGTLCLLTGSSKTGKTTLYNRVLKDLNKEPLLIRCDETITADSFWSLPLETLDFTRLKEIQNDKGTKNKSTGKIKGKIGWQWLAELIGEVSVGVEGNKSDKEIKELILSKPSPKHLIPLLKNSNAILVVEDFHYLTSEVQKHIFQQWKSFTDQNVSVIVVGTSHHGVDLAYANSDLIGRIQHIDLKRWTSKDLFHIIDSGFLELEIAYNKTILNHIAEESSGLPILTQQICSQLFSDKDLLEVVKGTDIKFTKKNISIALHNVATSKYKQFEAWYRRLTTGPRKKARKYNTYELILSIFSLDPLKFELERSEIDDRLNQLNLPVTSHPPMASVNSTLGSLYKFQKNNGFELLEWSKNNQAIYVLEPAFLFYLRWREERNSLDKTIQSLDDLLKSLNVAMEKL